MANISKIKTLDGTVYTINDSNAVHKTGDETVAGEKTLSGNTIISKSSPILSLQMLNLDTTQVSSSNKYYSAIGFCDKNGLEFKNRTAVIRSGISSTDSNFIEICAVNPTVDSTAEAHLAVHYSRDGKAKAIAPSTLTADDVVNSTMSIRDTDIITRDFIPKDTRIVHTTGDESIAGVKSFIDDIKISSICPNLYMTIDNNTKGTLPSSTNIRGIGWYDGSGTLNNSHKYGGVQNWIGSAGETKSYLLVFNNVSGSFTSGELGVRFDAGSTIPYAYAPSTPATGNATDIVTRDYADDKMSRKSYERIAGTSTEHKNLNDYTSAGFYNIATQYVDNVPVGIGTYAVLLVYPWKPSAGDGTLYSSQEITEAFSSTKCRRWIRKQNNGVWSEWKQIAFATSWSSTKLYSATLAEATTATSANPYTLTTTDFGTGYKELFIRLGVGTAQPTAATLRFKITFSDNSTLIMQSSNGISTSANNYVSVKAGNYDCLLFGLVCRSAGNPSVGAWYSLNGNTSTYMPQFAGIDDTITKIEIWSTSTSVTQLPSGMTIMIWGRK